MIEALRACLPEVIAHADWGSSPPKRWLAAARRSSEHSYLADVPAPVGEAGRLLQRLRQAAGPGKAALVGFDFPIGVPACWATRTGVTSFLDLLPRLGRGEWADFYHPAERAEQISLRRPFYPLKPGVARHTHLVNALGVGQIDDLRRRCDLAHPGRRAASPIFWTLGGQQVGKAAIHGWREVLAPGLQDSTLDLAFWPFSGELDSLLQAGKLVVVETYPAEMYTHLGITFSSRKVGVKTGKRAPAERVANGRRLLAWAARAGIELAPSLQTALHVGFGPSAEGEDPFDATVGLFGMINLALGWRPIYEPVDEVERNIEGWIFGQIGISDGRPKQFPRANHDNRAAHPGGTAQPPGSHGSADLLALRYRPGGQGHRQ